MSFCKNCGGEYLLPTFSLENPHYEFVNFYCESCGRYLDTVEIGGTPIEEGFGWVLKNEPQNQGKNRRSFEESPTPKKSQREAVEAY